MKPWRLYRGKLRTITGLAAGVAGVFGLMSFATPASGSPAASPAVPKVVVQLGAGPGEPMSVAWMPDGRHLVTISHNGLIFLWDTATEQLVDRLGVDECQLLTDPSGGAIAPPGALSHCQVPEIRPDPENARWIQPGTLSIAPDGKFALMLGQSDNGDIEGLIWNLDSRRTQGWMHRIPLAWIGAGHSRLVVRTADRCAADGCSVSVIDPETLVETPLPSLSGPPGPSAVSADAERFAMTVAGPGGRRRLEIIKADDLSAVGRFDLGLAAVEEVGFDKAGGRAFARLPGGELRVFDLAARTQATIKLTTHGAVWVTDLDAHAVLAESASRDPQGDAVFRLIDYRTGRALAKWTGEITGLYLHQGAALSNSRTGGAFLDFASAVVSPIDNPGDVPLERGDSGISSMNLHGPALSPDGRMLADFTPRIETLGAPKATRTLTGIDTIDGANFVWSPDAQKFAFEIGSFGNSVLWVFDLGSSRMFKVEIGSAPGPSRGSARPAPFRLLGWTSNSQLAFTEWWPQADPAATGARSAPLTAAERYMTVNVRTGEVTPLDGPPQVRSLDEAAPPGAGKPVCTPGGHRPPDQRAPVIMSSCFTYQFMTDRSLNIYSAWDWKRILTLYIHKDGTWFALGADSRYDTNQNADSKDIRWIMPNRPWVSLPAQTYMRDFYEPGLTGRLLYCNAARTCDRAFKPLPDLTSLNWVLPEVEITGVAPNPANPSAVLVKVRAKETYEATAPVGRQHSGVYDLRLFRDGKLVDEWPKPDEVTTPDGRPAMSPGPEDWTIGDDVDLGRWRAGTPVPGAQDGARVDHTFQVALPVDDGARKVSFSAYAFNADRVKGDTATLDYTPPVAPTPHLPRRAFVLAIGVDAYRNPDWKLNFAAADAHRIADQLARLGMPGYEIRPVTLTSETSPRLKGGALDLATKNNIRLLLSLLAHHDIDAGPSRQLNLAELRARGVDPEALSGFVPATPDDVVIVTFSGHGWASEKGDFYLVPSDGAPGPRGPDISTLISSADLVDWMRDVDAGEAAIVIDACHSAASVASENFKPGPFGDAGLGQLAYDKGIRILAGAQADAVAIEDSRLGQGLLTYALAREGLGDPDPKNSDLNPPAPHLDAGGKLPLDAWLKYAVQRLPMLSEKIVLRRMSPPADGADIVFDAPAAEAAPLQEPSLFDFTGKGSTVLLAGKPAPAEPVSGPNP